MKRFIISSLFTLALIVGATGAASSAHADPQGYIDGQACDINGQVGAGRISGGTCVSSVEYKSQSDATGNTQRDANLNDVGSGFGPIMTWIMSLFAWLVGVAALTLDYAVYYTVITMGNYVKNITAIGLTWRILRDIGNIALIFGFLAIGISIILNSERLGWGKKMLPMLLVGAIFLNFSLFFTEAIIDVGNLFATQFYQQINGGNIPQTNAGGLIVAADGTTLGTGNEGISNKLMAQLGLQTMYNPGNPKALTGNHTMLIGFMGIILFIITAFVMFSLAFILIARFVILIFLIILAPIGFAGLAIPQLAGKASKWWSTLFHQTITAPVLLLLLYIALAVITDAKFLTGFNASSTSGYLGFVDNVNLTGFAGMLLSFLVAMGLLLAVVISAKSLSAFGADKATKFAAALSFGATAYGASTLLSGTAFGLRKTLQRYAPNHGFTRGASRVLRFTEGMRADVRSIPGVSAGLASAGVGVAIGKSAVGRAKQGTDWLKKTNQESNQLYDKETRLPQLRTAIAANDHATIARLLGNMSDKELEESSMQRLLTNPANTAAVAALAQNRFDKLLTSDVLNDAQKNNLRAQRQTGINNRYADAAVYHNPPNHPTAPGAAIPSVLHPGTDMSRGEQAVRALTNEAASQLTDASLIRPEVYENLSVRQLNAIMNAGRIQDTTAATLGVHLQMDIPFIAYYASRNTQQRADLRSFWAIPVSGRFPI